VNHLFITHLHSDHIFGYGQFLLGGWANGRRRLTVIGPPGTIQFHNRIIEILQEDIFYRISLGRSSNGVLDVSIIEVEKSGPFSCDLPVQVTAGRMIHSFPTFAYRFQIGDKKVVFSGDTAPNGVLVELASNADILVHDCCRAPNSIYSNTSDQELVKIWGSLQEEHSSPKEAANIADKAGVNQLVLTHFLPNTDIDQTYKEASKYFSGNVILANDLDVIRIS
jgi:ribonuclease BN (tRNA processing enzyme)